MLGRWAYAGVREGLASGETAPVVENDAEGDSPEARGAAQGAALRAGGLLM